MAVDIRVLEVGKDPSLWQAFLCLPERIYHGDANYCAPLESSVLAELQRPDYQRHQKIWLALDAGQPVARLVAGRSIQISGLGTLGFFEALPVHAAVAALFAAGIAWLKKANCEKIIGPMNHDTWHRYRLNLGPQQPRPFLMEPYNPEYYPALWEAHGFQPLEYYYSKRLDDLTPAAARLQPIHQRALAQGFQFQRFQPRRFEREMGRVYAMTVRAFQGNFLYQPISFQDFLKLYQGMRSLMDPNLIWFAQNAQGEDVGFLFGYRDYFQAVAAMQGRKSLAGWFRYWRLKSTAQAVNFKTLGVVPEYWKSSVAAGLMYLGYQHALGMGIARGTICLIREGNISGGLDCGVGRLLRRYVLYHYTGEHPA